jgi:DNA-binding transcriptional LysR family regulator
MELRHLRYFVAVAEEGSLLTAAQRRLHTSQPSLSRQIRDLESEVGVRLLERQARGVALTAAGKVFLDHACLALSQVEAAIDGARRAEQPEKPVLAMRFIAGQEVIPLYAQNMLTPNVVARALDGVPPTIDLALGYNHANTNPLLLRLLSRADELVENVQDQSIIRYAV